MGSTSKNKFAGAQRASVAPYARHWQDSRPRSLSPPRGRLRRPRGGERGPGGRWGGGFVSDRAWNEGGGGAGDRRLATGLCGEGEGGGGWGVRGRAGGWGEWGPPHLTGIPETFCRAARGKRRRRKSPGAEPGTAGCPRLSWFTGARPSAASPLQAARHPPGTRRASAALSAPLPTPPARSLTHPRPASAATGGASFPRSLPPVKLSPASLRPAPPSRSRAAAAANRPGPPSAAPGAAPLSPASTAAAEGRRREAAAGGSSQRRNRAAPPGGLCAGRGGAGGSSPPGRPERGCEAGMAVAVCPSGKRDATWAFATGKRSSPARAHRHHPALWGRGGRRRGGPERLPWSAWKRSRRCVTRCRRRSPWGEAASVPGRITPLGRGDGRCAKQEKRRLSKGVKSGIFRETRGAGSTWQQGGLKTEILVGVQV